MKKRQAKTRKAVRKKMRYRKIWVRGHTNKKGKYISGYWRKR